MNQLVHALAEGIGASFRSPAKGPAAVCWIAHCARPPVMVLAANEGRVVHGCREHAREWIASDAWRLAAARSLTSL